MENYIKYITDITYQSELTLDIKDVKGLIRTNNLCRSVLKLLLHKLCAH